MRVARSKNLGCGFNLTAVAMPKICVGGEASEEDPYRNFKIDFLNIINF